MSDSAERPDADDRGPRARAPRPRSPDASPAHDQALLEVWTSRMTRTPYVLYANSQADADEQLDRLSRVLGRAREGWTVKPPRGWNGYGWPRRAAMTNMDDPIHKPWGSEYRVDDDVSTDVWQLFLDRERTRSRHRHPRKGTMLRCITGHTVWNIADGRNGPGSTATSDATLVEVRTTRDKLDLAWVVGRAGALRCARTTWAARRAVGPPPRRRDLARTSAGRARLGRCARLRGSGDRHRRAGRSAPRSVAAGTTR
jgi:hypothetical protein